MPTAPLDPKLKALIAKVTGKRALTVINHILKHGFITTEELKDQYGYDHPPRAVRDVRENGIPVETFRVQGGHGRSIGAYRFGDPSKIENHKLGGRQTFSKDLSETLYRKQNGRCALTGVSFERRYFQIDHRIPYEVAGDAISDESNRDAFMLISGAAQRQKSWSCENCPNWKGVKELAVCHTCYWASPEDYKHAETRQIRIVSLTFEGEAVAEYERLKQTASAAGKTVEQFVIDFIRGAVKR